MPAPAVEIAKVVKRYGPHTAVDNVTLTVAAGECLALVGHNGAGKTTLMKMMLGLARPSAGTVRVLGAPPSQHRDIGFLPETVALDSSLSGREMLAFFARLKSVAAREADVLLERVGLSDAADRRVKTYSKGMRQRLGLAQALLGAPKLLLLDEPTTGLDPGLRQRFYELVREVTRDGAAVILSSHILTELEARTDRVAIMNHGRLVACDTLDALSQAAELTVRIRLHVRDGSAGTEDLAERLGAHGGQMRINGRHVEIACGAGDKMPILKRIAALDMFVGDVEILPPTFDEVYARYCRAGDVL